MNVYVSLSIISSNWLHTVRVWDKREALQWLHTSTINVKRVVHKSTWSDLWLHPGDLQRGTCTVSIDAYSRPRVFIGTPYRNK